MRRLQNYTPATFANPSSTGQKRKRTREHFSCGLCRNRKVACDRQQPCENCVKLKCPDECHYDSKNINKSDEATASAGTGTASSSDLFATNARIAQLEGLVERLARKVGVDVESLHDGSPDGTDDTPVMRTRLEHSSHSNAILDHLKGYDALIYTAQHSWPYACGLEMKYFWKGGESVFPHLAHFDQIAVRFDKVRRKTLWDLAIISNPDIAPENDLLALLPDRRTCDVMVSRFLLSFNVVLPIIGPSHFQRGIDRFWQQKRSENSTWLAFYLAVIALGHQLPLTPPVDGAFEANGRKTGRKMMESIVPRAIRLAQQNRRPSVATFQTVLIFIFHEKLALDWVDGNDITNGYLGLLSRMASTMGLHRDPQNFLGMDEDEMNMRRKVFWTYTLVDLEHVLQSGMPCRYRDDGHDVEPPHEPSEGWSSYMRHIVDCIPSAEKALRFSHSRRIQASPRVVSELGDTYRRLASLGAHGGYSDSCNPELNTIMAIQRSTYACLNDKIQTLVQWPLSESNESAVKEAAEALMLESCTKILENVGWLTAQIARTPVAAREAWTHFTIALLRCPLYYAASLVTVFCGRRRTQGYDFEKDEVLTRLRHLARETLGFLAAGAPISSNTAKTQVIYWAHYHTVTDRADAHGSAQLSTCNLDLDTAAGRQLVTATKKVMNTEMDRVVAAIDEAGKRPNPFPSLLEAVQPDRTSDRRTNPHNGDASLNEAEMSDWLFAFDSWPMGPDLFEDVTAPWV